MNIGLFFSHERITSILDTMTKKLEKCRSRKFAKHFVGRWIDLNIKEGTMTQVKNNISKCLTDKFSQWQYVLVVYPQHHGGHKHWTSYHVHRFRHYGHNIVLHFLPPQNSKSCKDPARDKWCRNWGPCNNSRIVKPGFQCKDDGDDDAHEWYDWIKNHPKDFGHLRALTVLQGKRLAFSGQNVCRKELKIEKEIWKNGSICRTRTNGYNILTIIYA